MVAAMNGDVWDEEATDLALDQTLHRREAESALRDFFAPRFSTERVRDAVMGITDSAREGPPLRQHADVSLPQPSSFARYDTIVVELSHEIMMGSRILESTLASPFAVTSLWAAPVSRLLADVKSHLHDGFVTSVNQVAIEGRLLEVLAEFDGRGTCSIDVASPKGGFRHSFCFESA